MHVGIALVRLLPDYGLVRLSGHLTACPRLLLTALCLEQAFVPGVVHVEDLPELVVVVEHQDMQVLGREGVYFLGHFLVQFDEVEEVDLVLKVGQYAVVFPEPVLDG